MKKEIEKEYIEREKKLIDIEYNFISDFIKTRKDANLTQQQMADKANVIRTTVARIENLMASPQLNTLIKLLEPIGYTIKIEPIDKNLNDK